MYMHELIIHDQLTVLKECIKFILFVLLTVAIMQFDSNLSNASSTCDGDEVGVVFNIHSFF